ncbi:hypothetical protein G3N59_01125 [Paraburkholderia sp. Ac-20340]|uniref:hypothetical protein n=1 Tax=Paraburkholderia sp. Ac-20340 TaxID=2703888 RepID=UPI001980B73A|nr:hypothetical protein [Paraburkholderia sp. Ac-20340]MBN3851969.1 hypothetical protein [Paraburkholderia sp. Ac-20340]
MLTGKELGDAISVAIKRKGVTKKAFADAMGVRPASVQDWIKYGRVAKVRINDLIEYFSDVADAGYWGLNFDPLMTIALFDSFESAKSANRGQMNDDLSSIVNPEVNPGSTEVTASLKSERDTLDQFINELREAFESGKLTPKRLALLRDLLQDGIDSQPLSYAEQKLTTRGVHGGARGHTARKKTG